MRAYVIAACVVASLAGCNVVLGIDEPTFGADPPQLHDLSVAMTPGASDVFFHFDVLVTNNGPDDANDSCVRIELPFDSLFGTGSCGDAHGNDTVCCLPTMHPGESTQLGMSAEIVNGTITATVNSPGDIDAGNDRATIMMDGSSDLEMRPLLPIPSLVGAGTVQSYTFRVANLGPGKTNQVAVNLTTTGGAVASAAAGIGWTCAQSPMTCTLYSPLPAMTNAYSLKWNVVMPATPGDVTVTGTVSSSSSIDRDQSNNSTTYMQTVTTAADLLVNLIATPDPVAPSGTLTYTIDVHNSGLAAVTSVSVTDTLPAGATFVSATGTGWTCSNASQTVTCTRAALGVTDAPPISVVVTAPPTAGIITNTVAVSSANPETNAVDNTASITTTVQ